MKELIERLESAQEKECPYVIYRKPNSEEVTAIIQKDKSLNISSDLSENAFVFAPFDENAKTVMIPYSISNIFTVKSKKTESAFINKELVNSENGKLEHVELVKKGIDYINESHIDKVVLSRKEVVDFTEVNVLNTFQKLCNYYPNAFVYLWSHSKTGIWMGASPERLLTVKNNKFKVMALASTQKYEETLNVVWGDKEKQEHQIVVDYISEKMRDYNLSISETYTVKAGDLLHLRTDLKGSISESNRSLEPLIKVLHPTPAVCGLPKEASKQFILNTESYNREYYTGFLGELIDSEADLFVNLRCMKIDLLQKKASIYVGGGITKDSIPENEWLETVAKTNIMKKALH